MSKETENDILNDEDLVVENVDVVEEDVELTEGKKKKMKEGEDCDDDMDKDNDGDVDDDDFENDEDDEDDLDEENAKDYKLQVKDKKDGKVSVISVKGSSQKDAIARAKKDDRFVVIGALKETKKVMKEDIDISEDLNAIFGADSESLSEEFKSRTKNIFEAAVIASANKYLEENTKILEEEFEVKKQELEEEYSRKLDEAYEAMVESVDGYLTKAIDDWYDANEVKVQSNIRADLAESFLGGLKKLFEEHYIDVPEDKVDVVKELVESNEELEAKLESEINKSVELSEQLKDLKKQLVIENVTRDLSFAQKSKLETLAEGIEYDDDFESRLTELKDSYINESVTRNSVEDDFDTIDESLINEEIDNLKNDDGIDRVKIDDRFMKFFGKK